MILLRLQSGIRSYTTSCEYQESFDIYRANQIKYRVLLCCVFILTYLKIMSTKRNDLTREYGDPGLNVIMALRNISSIMSLFGGRMFLNLKEAGGSRSKGTTSPNRNTITTVSALRFANSLLHSRMYISLILTLTLYFTDFYQV